VGLSRLPPPPLKKKNPVVEMVKRTLVKSVTPKRSLISEKRLIGLLCRGFQCHRNFRFSRAFIEITIHLVCLKNEISFILID